MGDIFTGNKTVGLPSGHPGPLCSENMPAELNNWIKAEEKQSFSLSGTL